MYASLLNTVRAHSGSSNLLKRGGRVFLLIAGLTFSVALARQPKDNQESRTGSPPVEPKENDAERTDRSVSDQPADVPLSDAERIARLQRVVAENEKLLGELRAKLNDPQDEYAKADAEFAKLDGSFKAKKKELQKLKDAGSTDTSPIEADIAALEPQWKLAKERFDLAIEARRALQEQVATFEQKIRQDQEAIKKLTDAKVPSSRPDEAQSPSSVQGNAVTTTPSVPAKGSATGTDVPSPPAEPQTITGTTKDAPASGESAAAQPQAAALPGTANPPQTADKPSGPSPALVEAQQEAGKKANAAAEAAQEAKSITQRVESLSRNIELERNLLANARNRAENAQEMERTLDEQLQRRWTEGAEQNELDELRQRRADARARFQEAQAEIADRTDRLDMLQSEMGEVQADEITALRSADLKRIEAEEAKKKVDRLENPFAPHNLLQWVLDHGPRIVLIFVGMAVILWVARLLERRITDWMSHHGKSRGTPEDENRARTLVGVFHNAIRILVVLGGTFMVLAEAGVNIIPLMGGAAVVGLAAAFGAQNLLRDYFTGFMILLENQYAINDVVKIGSTAGLVERITLRLTVLRDLDGTVHFIPNGHVETVSNMTHGWSRALFDIRVAYKEDIDRVMETLVELGKELRRDQQFRHMILEQPEMLGVDEFGESGALIKFFIKTRPLMQWNVKREMLRRIKKKFDELGIEIPYPHRMLYYHHAQDGDAGARHESTVGAQPGEAPRC